jgi:vitamin K-dependent gamma-carboxylase
LEFIPKQILEGRRWRSYLGSPVDAASCVFFRVVFGATVAYWAWDYLASGIVTTRYVKPLFHATYYPFDFVKPSSGNGMYIVFLAMVALGLCTAAGAFFRTSSLLLAFLFTYVFLIDRTNYQNHYYLTCLIAWWLPWMPLNRMVSVDAWRKAWMYGETIPRWVLWVLKFHIGLPYFMGGVAKLIPDWLLGYPMNEMIQSKQSMPILGFIASWEYLGILMAWGGLLFDLLIVPFLIWKKTRIPAYLVAIVFHITNSVVFNIHIFPWLMIAATPIFFDPSWPRRLLSTGRPLAPLEIPTVTSLVSRWFGYFLIVYMAFHLLWPLRHHLYDGDSSWHERGHYFSWRMMLRGKRVVMGIAIKDHVTNQVLDGNVSRYLTPEQQDKLGRDPEMILQLAHFIRDEYKKETDHDSSVYALVLVSLNGRKPELIIDPNIDLAREPRGLHFRHWILKQTEPLRWPPWNVPPNEWRNHIEMPELHFLKNDSPSRPDLGIHHRGNLTSGFYYFPFA